MNARRLDFAIARHKTMVSDLDILPRAQSWALVDIRRRLTYQIHQRLYVHNLSMILWGSRTTVPE